MVMVNPDRDTIINTSSLAYGRNRTRPSLRGALCTNTFILADQLPVDWSRCDQLGASRTFTVAGIVCLVVTTLGFYLGIMADVMRTSINLSLINRPTAAKYRIGSRKGNIPIGLAGLWSSQHCFGAVLEARTLEEVPEAVGIQKFETVRSQE